MKAKHFYIALPFLLLTAIFALRPQMAFAHLVAFSDYEQHGNIYIGPGVEFNETLQQDLAAGEARVKALFDGSQSQPVIIIVTDENGISRYGNNYGAMHPGIFGEAIVMLGPIGMKSIDIIAHELAHAEHYSRIGYLGWMLTPAWFIEGLGMQVDHRPAYQQAHSADALQAVQRKVTFSDFMQGDLTANYSAARLAVMQMLDNGDLLQIVEVQSNL